MPMSDDQIRQFQETGFLFFESLFSQKEIDTLTAQIPTILTRQAEARAREKSGMPGFPVHETVEPYRNFIRHPRLLTVAEQLLGSKVHLWHTKFSVKDPFLGGVAMWHQDFGYWCRDGIQPRVVTCFVYFDEPAEESGPMCILPGSHKLGYVDHHRPAEQTTTSYEQWTIPSPRLQQIVEEHPLWAVPERPGSAIFFDAYMIHGAGHNISATPRRNVIVCYNAVDNTPRGTVNPRPDFVVGRNYATLEPVEDKSLL
jgi:ectoine hydroxylase